MTPPSIRLFVPLALAAFVASPVRPLAEQARDARPSAQGAVTLSGTVIADDNGRPVVRALVTVKGLVPPFAQVASTDAQGNFDFAGLPVGDVTVTAAKATYLTAYYGAHDPIRGPAVPFSLGSSSPARITLRLVRAGVIAGVVTGPTGRPQPSVQVSARLSRLVGGVRHLTGGPRGEGGVTDDRGRYRIWGLAPGEYVVEATPANVQTAVRSTSDADVQWAMALASGARASAPPSAGRVVRFSPVYYPGTVDAGQVAPVAIRAGEEHDGVDLTLQTIQTADLRGTVVGIDGQPVAHETIALEGALEQSTTTSDEAGRFEFPAVAPGNLTLSARDSSRRLEASDTPTAQNLWASLNVTVNGEDQTGLTLSLRHGMTAAGRVMFEGPDRPADSSHAVIGLQPVGSQLGSARPVQTTATADGSFALTDLAPGRYQVLAALVPLVSPGSAGPWLAKSALWQGQDLLDGTFDVAPDQNLSGITVVFSDRQTDLRGVFFDSAGRPVASYDVVVFAADTGFWTRGSRRIQHAVVGPDGRFDFPNLPAGDYLLAAVTHVDAEDLADPDWLSGVAPLALHVTLANGEHKVQDIRLGR